MHKSTLQLTLSAILIFILGACSNSTESNINQQQVVDTTNIVPEKVEPIKLKYTDTILTYDISTTQEALDFMNNSPRADRYNAGILPTMAKDNLDYTIKLLKNSFDYFIVVDKPSMFVVLFDRYGVEKRAYKMACSKRYGTKHKRRDNRTPEGFFSAEGIYNSTEWLYTDDDGNTSPIKGQFGPRFIRLKTDVTSQVGIHGTCAPWSLGRRASHGCIRIHNDNIMELVRFAKPGMPIIVNPSKYDIEVNTKEGYTVPTINIGKPVELRVPKPEELQEIDTIKEEIDTTIVVTTDSISVADSVKVIESTPITPNAPDSLVRTIPDSIPAD